MFTTTLEPLLLAFIIILLLCSYYNPFELCFILLLILHLTFHAPSEIKTRKGHEKQPKSTGVKEKGRERYKVFPDWRDDGRWHYVDKDVQMGWKGWWDDRGGVASVSLMGFAAGVLGDGARGQMWYRFNK